MHKVYSVLASIGVGIVVVIFFIGLFRAVKQIDDHARLREQERAAKEERVLSFENKLIAVTSDFKYFEFEYSFWGISRPSGHEGVALDVRSEEFAWLIREGIREKLSSVSYDDMDDDTIIELEFAAGEFAKYSSCSKLIDHNIKILRITYQKYGQTFHVNR